MFQKYVSDSKNLKGIYEYDRGVQGSENLLFYKEIKKEVIWLLNPSLRDFVNSFC